MYSAQTKQLNLPLDQNNRLVSSSGIRPLYRSLIMEILSVYTTASLIVNSSSYQIGEHETQPKTTKTNSLATFRSAHTCTVSTPSFLTPSPSHPSPNSPPPNSSKWSYQHRSINIITHYLPQTILKHNIFRLLPQLNFYETIIVGHTYSIL